MNIGRKEQEVFRSTSDCIYVAEVIWTGRDGRQIIDIEGKVVI